ncbi:MAG TPA: SRPBCC family protein [Pseudonocardiaceae bacterium]
MKTITASADVARSAQEVFALVSDAARLPLWQPSVDQAALEPPGQPSVGARGYEVRRVQGKPRTFHWEITEYEPNTVFSVRGTDGPVRAHARIACAAIDGGSATQVDYRLGFEGHGIGKVFAVLARRGARKEVPASLALLKQHLERSANPSDSSR